MHNRFDIYSQPQSPGLHVAWQQPTAQGRVMPFMCFFLAFFLPSLALFLLEGFSARFWIALLLTTLGFLPGVLYAQIIIFRRESEPRFFLPAL